MCDPLSIGVIATVGSLAATGYGAYTQYQAVQNQNDANAAWRNWQDQQRLMAQGKEEAMRKQADANRTDTLDKLKSETQGDAQGAEAARLSEYYNSNPTVNDADVNAALLSGQAEGGTEFQTDVAQRLAKASQDARERIKALATVNSFGGSEFGLANRNANVLREGDQNIALQNNMRQGNLSAYGIAKAVNPMQLSPVTDYASGIGNALAGIAGNKLGQYYGSTGKV